MKHGFRVLKLGVWIILQLLLLNVNVTLGNRKEVDDPDAIQVAYNLCGNDAIAQKCILQCWDSKKYIFCITRTESAKFKEQYVNCTLEQTVNLSPLEINSASPFRLRCQDRCMSDPKKTLCELKCNRNIVNCSSLCESDGQSFTKPCLSCRSFFLLKEFEECEQKCTLDFPGVANIGKMYLCKLKCEIYPDPEFCTYMCQVHSEPNMKRCLNNCQNKANFSSNAWNLANKAECQINCYTKYIDDKSYLACQSFPSFREIDLLHPSSCRWEVKLSAIDKPYAVKDLYFDESSPIEMDEMQHHPNVAQYLIPPIVGGVARNFSFPYFIVLQPKCEPGYPETFYHGYSSVYQLTYFSTPPLFRTSYTRNQRIRSIVSHSLSFKPVLVNVDFIGEHKEETCHLGMCNPAFAAPLGHLQLPFFDVVVFQFEKAFRYTLKRKYSNPFHSRRNSGIEKTLWLQKKILPLTGDLFNRKSRIDSVYSPLYRKMLDDCAGDVCKQVDSGDTLDYDDIFVSNHVYHSATSVGFHRPTYGIVMDPDLEFTQLFEWDEEKVIDVDPERKTECLRNDRPIYLELDLFDSIYPINYYRFRYSSNLNYSGSARYNAVFEAISIDGRLMLTMMDGIVVLYGHNYNFKKVNKEGSKAVSEYVPRCFKFMRAPRISLPNFDIFVGVTYSYWRASRRSQFDPKTGGYSNVIVSEYIDQEIWVGVLGRSVEAIQWTVVGKDELLFEGKTYAERQNSFNGDEESGDERKIMTKGRSQIEWICTQVHSEVMWGSKEISYNASSPDWCQAIDATVVPTKEKTFQILVRMSIVYKPVRLQQLVGSSSKVVFYVIASHTLMPFRGQSYVWTIDSVIPRIPCEFQTQRGVQSVSSLNMAEYFEIADEITHTKKTIGGGCHENYHSRINHLYFSGITYTRSFSNHMFAYGSHVLHSTDGGVTFTRMRGFNPAPDKPYLNRVVVMTFNSIGSFAFFTSKRELWYGSLGTDEAIKLRPSDSFNLVNTRLSNRFSFSDAEPILVSFDAFNELHELVIVEEFNGMSVEKRHIPKAIMLKSEIYLRDLKNFVVSVENSSSLIHSTFNLYCPFNFPRYEQNYSKYYDRTQVMHFEPPEQNFKLGFQAIVNTLAGFQAIVFFLMHALFVEQGESSYSGVQQDALAYWSKEKQEASDIGRLRFLMEDPMFHGILLDPKKYAKLFKSDTENILSAEYHLDYNLVVKLEMEYSIYDGIEISQGYLKQSISDLDIHVDNGNASILQLHSRRYVRPFRVAVVFSLTLSIKKNTGLLNQAYPGQKFITVPVQVYFIGAFGKCFNEEYGTRTLDNTVAITVYAGCPPSYKILFNWNKTAHSIKYKDRKAVFGFGSDCYGGASVCFYVRSPMIFYFDIYDEAQRVYKPYEGKYKLRVVAGGYNRDKLFFYSPSDQNAFNIPGISDISLIWSEWDEETDSRKDQAQTARTIGRQLIYEEVTLQSGKSMILWSCQSFSPCASVSPAINGEAFFWFRVNISNKDIENETLCLYETQFDILLYGFVPAPIHRMLYIIAVIFIAYGLLYLMFICLRKDRQLWYISKARCIGQWEIIKEAFPKRLLLHQKKMEIQKDQEYLRSSITSKLRPSLISNISGGSGHSVSPGSPSEIMSVELTYEEVVADRLDSILKKNQKIRLNMLKKLAMYEHNEDEFIYHDLFSSGVWNEPHHIPPM